jgi:colanic acid/amylovoran biosynthesis protein
MRVAVTHVYSRKNKGDSAILACQLSELRRVFPGAELDIFTLERVSDGETFEGVPLRRSLMSTVVGGKTPRFLRPAVGILMMVSTLGWAAAKRVGGLSLPLPAAWRTQVHAMGTCAAQVCVGGGYLRGTHSYESTYALLLLLHQIAFGRVLGKPVYLYAQSFGPFPGTGQRFLFRCISRLSTLILPRESISLAMAREIGGTRTRIEPVIDSAFLLEIPSKAPIERWFPRRRPETIVGITAREWLIGQKQTAYELALVELIARILERGWGVMVIPQVTADRDDDRVVGRRLASRLPAHEHLALVEDELDFREISSLYAALDLLVGTRFHSVIFALCAGVPCLAIEYEHKTSGILRDLGLGEWCLPIEELRGADLISMFDRLASERHALKPRIAAAVAAARRHAERGADLIASHFHGLATQAAPSRATSQLSVRRSFAGVAALRRPPLERTNSSAIEERNH